MIKKLRLSFWIYIISLILFGIFLLGLVLEFFHFSYPVLLLIVYAGAYFSPIAIFLLIIDTLFNKEYEKKYFILAILMNLIFIGVGIDFMKEFSQSFMHLS